MWFNGSGGGDLNMGMNMNMNMAINSTTGANMGMNSNFLNMSSNFNENNHDVFDFSLHSSSMQQGTESASTAIPVSIAQHSISYPLYIIINCSNFIFE